VRSRKRYTHLDNLFPSLAKDWPMGLILIAACVALWRNTEKSNAFLAQLLATQTERNRELANSIQEIAKGVAESNVRVASAIETLADGISDLRSLLSQRPCIAQDMIEDHHPQRRAKHGD